MTILCAQVFELLLLQNIQFPIFELFVTVRKLNETKNKIVGTIFVSLSNK